MIEMLIVAAIWTVVVKRGVEDILHTARGGTPPRLAAAKARRQSGAAGRYWRTLWDDTFEDLLQKHTAKRAARDIHAPRPDRGSGPMRSVVAGFADDFGRWARATWRHGWDEVGRRRQEKRVRPRPGQQTVPGTVVPNRPQDEDGPQDEVRPEPSSVPDEDGTDLQDEGDLTETTSEDAEQEDEIDDQRDAWRVTYPNGQSAITNDYDHYQRVGYPLTKVRGHDDTNGFRITREYPHTETAPTQEGSTTMTTTIPTTGEIVGLEQGITFFETSAQAYTAMVGSIEQTIAGLDGFDVSGPARAEAAAAMEQSANAAASAARVAEELKKHRIVAEAIDATPGAGRREFYTAGR